MNFLNLKYCAAMTVLIISASACKSGNADQKGSDNTDFTMITLAPGHFHASLVQKLPLEGVSKDVYVYAPDGAELSQYLERIESFNKRAENPTSWNEIVYKGNDFVQKMIQEKKGDFVIFAGNNKDKTEYIYESVNAGLNVLADKPMAINSEDFKLLEKSFDVAKQKGVELYDIMTERYDIHSTIQRLLMFDADLFGSLQKGTLDKPAVEVESVHHFYKVVSGIPLIRPVWYYDVKQQGEGLVDVTTHLVDLIHWKCFPEQIVDYKKDVEVLKSSHWPTPISSKQFELSTGSKIFPDFLSDCVKDDKLMVYANGDFTYKVKDVYAKVVVIWNFEAPKGTGDTHRCIIKGSNAVLSILQDKEQNYAPKLYISKNNSNLSDADFEVNVNNAVKKLQANYKEIEAVKTDKEGVWEIVIPNKYAETHEVHFTKVIQKYLGYLKNHDMPEWEIPNTLAKYYITTTAMTMSAEK